MPQILVPGVAQFKLSGSVGPGVWDCIFHFQGTPPGGAYTVPQLQSMITAFANISWTSFLAEWPATTDMTSLTGVDLGVTNPAEYTGALGLTGTAPGEQDGASCFLINYSSSARYRGGKPRTYLPGFTSQQQSSPNSWAGTAVTAGITAWGNAMAAMAAGGASAGVSGCVQCYPRYLYSIVDVPSKHKYLRTRTALDTVVPITGHSGNPLIKTQRRRLRAG